MAAGPISTIEVLYLYAHLYEYWRKQLETHLSNLKRQGFITGCHIDFWLSRISRAQRL